MYSYLRGQMIKAGISIVQLSRDIGVSEKTLRNKLNGETEFTWMEVQAIHRIVNPSLSIDELFIKDEEVPA